MNGVTTTQSYDAANQVLGWSYDAAGNLLSDGSSAFTYDALGRTTSQGGTALAYNGDGVLVAQTSAGVTTRYAQDLAAPLSQVLGDGSATYLYGLDRLRAAGGPWYLADALGSLRLTLDGTGAPLGTASYDPWGVPASGMIAPFGFTGELQDATGLTYLRARWYDAGAGTFTSKDPFAGFPRHPYTQHPYAYGLSSPINLLDPTGECATWIIGDPNCQFIGWDRVQAGDLEWEDGRAWAGAAVDFTPGVGDIKGLIEVFTGCDIVTGEDLGDWRWLGLLGVSELRAGRHLDNVSLQPLNSVPSTPRHYGSSLFDETQKHPYMPSSQIFGQLTDGACAGAACRMLASERGVTIAAEVARRGVVEGASLEEMVDFLLSNGVFVKSTGVKNVAGLQQYLNKGPVIVGIPLPGLLGRRHAVIIDKIDAGMVYIRDPLPSPQGSSYAISVSDLNEKVEDTLSAFMTVIYSP